MQNETQQALDNSLEDFSFWVPSEKIDTDLLKPQDKSLFSEITEQTDDDFYSIILNMNHYDLPTETSFMLDNVQSDGQTTATISPETFLPPAEEKNKKQKTNKNRNKTQTIHQEYYQEMLPLLENLALPDVQENPTKKKKTQTALPSFSEREKTYLSHVLKTPVSTKKGSGIAILKGIAYKNCQVQINGSLIRNEYSKPRLEVNFKECNTTKEPFKLGSFEPSRIDQGNYFTFSFDLLLPKKIKEITNGRPFEMEFRLVDENDHDIYHELFPTALMGFDMQFYAKYTKNCLHSQNYQGILFQY